MLEIDGRTGEGGGQLVRIACAIASVITQPIRITNVRGNRERGGSYLLSLLPLPLALSPLLFFVSCGSERVHSLAQLAL